MSEYLSVRLQFGLRLVDAADRRGPVATALVDGTLGPLASMATRKRDKFGRYARSSVDGAVKVLASQELEGLVFDNGKRAVESYAEVENGMAGIGADATKFRLVVAVPLSDRDAQLRTITELAGVLEVAAGFVACEATFKDAQTVALGSSRLPDRATLGEARRRERVGRSVRGRRAPTQIAGPEWGTFLGPGHLDQVSAAQLRDSGAFERVVEISPRLVFLQLTADPRDDLSGKVEEKLPAARDALRPLLMDLADVIVD